MPFFLALSFIIFFFITKKKYEKKETIRNFIQALKISIFIFQPNIFQNLFNLLDCKSFNPQPGKSFIRTFLSEECYTNQYQIWTLGFVLPTFLCYAIFEPLLTFLYLFKNRPNFNNTRFLVKISFLIQGLDKSKFYW